MLIKKRADIRPSDITPPEIYRSRRRFLTATALGGLALAGGGLARRALGAPAYPDAATSPFSTDEEPNSLHDITHYNNFYELGTGKRDPARFAQHLKPRPWSVEITGECEKPGVFDVDDLIRAQALEERIYRLRCVEGWSMVIPWVGFPLAEVLRRAQPTSRAKYVEFTTLLDKKMFPGQRVRVLDWPYVEGLRMEEAIHPLTILAVGLYGDVLPNQNGAPLRLVVPWKYGFKSIKSIVRIRFVEEQPVSTWMKAAPREYGFYSNVNPNVDHPRWSQASERRIGEFLKRDTLMFNGYGDEVAHLYAGMDLKKHF